MSVKWRFRVVFGVRVVARLCGRCWTAEKDTGSGTTSGTESGCVISTSGSRYNSWLLTIRIALPADYSCAADCWWKIHYNYPGL